MILRLVLRICSVRSGHLVVLTHALHCDITNNLWDGAFVTLEVDAPVAPIGSDEDAAEMNLRDMLSWK